ncbi:osmotically inducible protein C [Lottiidibacillus patelloidae]|uniref:Osmotically inducible protein C n=1 Tax=Lottiidibacillus patelloidae TaxID=2670334 RepID=A0A263BTN4_9BACI|nr:OsmC family protein [Lottiidibacillus patelloidae]OZM57035.1 osmotically inducible protein C [Lottiidibacillus patelloidae]
MKFEMKEDVGFKVDLAYGELHVAGDEDYGFRPFQLMVSSIAVCSGGVLRKILAKQRVEITNMTIEADVERNEEEANRIEKIHIHFLISGKDLKEEKLRKAVELSSKNCPMVQSVKGSIEIKETFAIVD